MSSRYLGASLLVLAAAAAGESTRAADMPALFPQASYEEAEPAPRYEFGTGWYLRGDLSASYDDELRYSPAYLGALATTPFTPAAFAATGQDVLTKRQDWGYAAGAGVGYKVNNWFRTDITGDYLSNQRFNAGVQSADGGFTTVGKGTLRRWDGLVNGYIDLGNWTGFQPYIGAGVGFSALKSKGRATTTFAGVATDYTINESAQYNLAFAAMAGVGYQIAPHMLLDVGYRYLDLGSYRVPVTNEKKDFVDQQARVGIRYVID